MSVHGISLRGVGGGGSEGGGGSTVKTSSIRPTAPHAHVSKPVSRWRYENIFMSAQARPPSPTRWTTAAGELRDPLRVSLSLPPEKGGSAVGIRVQPIHLSALYSKALVQGSNHRPQTATDPWAGPPEDVEWTCVIYFADGRKLESTAS